jgi:hypothetical protein
MVNSARLRVFGAALHEVISLQAQYPNDPSIRSIVAQLQYLIELEEGRRTDRERLNDIVIGILTIREIQQLDSSVADMLYHVEEEVDRMKTSTY